MPATYEPISTQTLGTAIATVDFTSIPQTYTDLVLVVSARTTSGANVLQYRLNSDTASNYSGTYLTGDGTSAASYRISGATVASVHTLIAIPNATDTFGTYIINFQNYTNATTFKTAISRANTVGNGAYNGTEASVTLWRKTPEAITSINILNGGALSFAIGSTFTLYGVKAA